MTAWWVDITIATGRPIVGPEICEDLTTGIGHDAVVGVSSPLGDLAVGVCIDAEGLPEAVTSAIGTVGKQLVKHHLAGPIVELVGRRADQTSHRGPGAADSGRPPAGTASSGPGRHRRRPP